MVRNTHLYIDMIFAFYGYGEWGGGGEGGRGGAGVEGRITPLHCLVGCLSMVVWTHVLF